MESGYVVRLEALAEQPYRVFLELADVEHELTPAIARPSLLEPVDAPRASFGFDWDNGSMPPSAGF